MNRDQQRVRNELTLLLNKHGGGTDISVLIIGEPERSILDTVRRFGAEPVVIGLRKGSAPGNSIRHELHLESAMFPADTFDIIICTRSLEAFESHSELLRNAWRWLVPYGALVLCGGNAASWLAQLRPNAWKQYFSRGGTAYLFGANHLRELADYYGFDIHRLRLRSNITDVAVVLFGDGFPSALAWLVAAPLALGSTFLNIGDAMTAVCIKRGLAMKPLLRPVEELLESGEHDFAPAMYSGRSSEF